MVGRISAALLSWRQLLPLGRSASPQVAWRLLGALYGYALALRLYNGDWAPDAVAAASVLLAAAPFLGWGHLGNVD